MKPVDRRRQQTDNERLVRAHSNFACGRIGKKLYILHCLALFVEYRGTSIQQCAAVLCRFNTLATTIKQPHAECLL